MTSSQSKPRVRVQDQAAAPAAAQTPSETIVAEAVKTSTITDDRGRRITVRRLSPLDRMRLFGAAGNDLASNEQWIGMAALAASCAAIDDDPVPKPATRMQIEALVERLDDDGLSAIAEVYQTVFGIGVMKDGDEKEAAKN